MKTLFALALKLLIRDARRGELLILALSLLIAVSATTAIDLLADRLDRTMIQAAAEFMGGDLALSGHQPLAVTILEEASRRGLESAETTEFSSMLVEQNELLLAGVKAIPDHYPLRGTFKIRETLNGAAVETRDIPGPQEVWVESTILSALHLTLGDPLTVGEATFKITRILAYEPDRRGDIYSLSPRILINAIDLEATHIVQPGSHVHRIAVFNGHPEALKAFKQWLKPQLLKDQHLNDLDEDRPELGKAIGKAKQYLGLSSVAVVILAGVAIAMSTRRHLRRHYDLIAILKCHGATSRDILVLQVFEYLMIGLVVSVPAAGLGWLLESLLVTLMRPLLPGTLMNPGSGAFLMGIGSGLLILFGFSLPIIQRLRRLPPLRVLRRELEPAGSPWPIYLTASITIGWLLSRHSDSWWMVLGLFGGGGILCLVMGSLAYIGLIATRRLIPLMPLSARLGFQHLSRTPLLTVTQIVVF
ncbi:MAG: FtsX-like permease family protein, partial [Gammaproteobacteria bacterium]|nr:FtsX-like permease family protein [Gammaproteobacteria bacterium]